MAKYFVAPSTYTCDTASRRESGSTAVPSVKVEDTSPLQSSHSLKIILFLKVCVVRILEEF